MAGNIIGSGGSESVCTLGDIWQRGWLSSDVQWRSNSWYPGGENAQPK